MGNQFQKHYECPKMDADTQYCVEYVEWYSSCWISAWGITSQQELNIHYLLSTNLQDACNQR
jgi:hypothetical protein